MAREGMDAQGPYRLVWILAYDGAKVLKKQRAFRFTCTRCGQQYWAWPEAKSGLCANCLFNREEASGEDQEHTA